MKTKSNMTVNKPKELDWEKVKEQYKDWCFYNKQHLGRMFDSEAFWDFYLKQTLQQQREEIIKEIEGIVGESEVEFHGPVDVTGILDKKTFLEKLKVLEQNEL